MGEKKKNLKKNLFYYTEVDKIQSKYWPSADIVWLSMFTATKGHWTAVYCIYLLGLTKYSPKPSGKETELGKLLYGNHLSYCLFEF